MEGAPRLSALRLSSDALHASVRHRAAAHAVTVSYHDTVAAHTTLEVLSGSGATRHCTLVASLTHADGAGGNVVRLTGRVGGHPLAAGRHVLRLSATFGSAHSNTLSAPFRVLAPGTSG